MRVARVAFGGLALILGAGAVFTDLMTRRIEARYPPAGQFLNISGGRLHYVEAGPPAAEPLGTIVFLHGASSNQADAMLAIGRQLAERYRVIAMDRPGHGWSDRLGGAEVSQPARQAALVAEALRKLKVEKAVIVGHSWAGAVVPNLALDHPDVIGGMVLLAPVTHPWPGAGISWYYRPATSILGWLFARTVAPPVGAIFTDVTIETVFAPQAPPTGYAEAASVPLVLRPASFEANAQDVTGLHAAVTAQSPRYRNIQIPAVVIAGDADRIVWTDIHARAFAREVPQTKLIVLAGVGHMPHHARKDLVIDEIDALVRRTGEAKLAKP